MAKADVKAAAMNELDKQSDVKLVWYVCMYVCMYMCTCVYISLSIHIYIYIYMYIYIHVYISICIHTAPAMGGEVEGRTQDVRGRGG